MNPVLKGDRECGEPERNPGGGPLEAEVLAQSGIDATELLMLSPSDTYLEGGKGGKEGGREVWATVGPSITIY